MSKLIDILFNKKAFKLGETTNPVEPVYSQILAFELNGTDKPTRSALDLKGNLKVLKNQFEKPIPETNEANQHQ